MIEKTTSDSVKVNNRTLKAIQSGKKKSLAEAFPEIAAEWHPTMNGELKPEIVTASSREKVWWKCEHGHKWQAIIDNRTKGNGCPYCSGRRPVSGITDLATTHPEIAAEWNYAKNGDLTPEIISAGSGKKIWWQGKCGHEWESTVAHRTAHHSDCPYCSGRNAIKGKNDLQTINPSLASEWNYKKNKLTPLDVLPYSNKKVWWQCKHGHEWEAVISSRTQGNGCPYCASRKVLPGFNDLATTHPELTKEWHPTKNGDLSSQKVSKGSTKKVWWSCEYSHEWQATISSRAKGSGCPYCSQNGTSRPELTLLYYIRKYISPNTIHRYRDLGFELDIYIPNLKIGLEYDGYQHRDKEAKDILKNKKCLENDIKLYRIREDKLSELDDSSINYFYRYGNDTSFSEVISKLLTDISGNKININVTEDFAEINDFINYAKIEESLAIKYPQIAAEWHSTKNGSLTPEMVTAHSGKKVWWQCDHGHEWDDTIAHRTTEKRNCPYCSGHRVLSGFNDLVTTHPELAKEWHPTQNNDLTPEMVTSGSGKKVWWKCTHCGYEYQRSIDKQTRKDSNPRCPHCKTPVTAAKSA